MKEAERLSKLIADKKARRSEDTTAVVSSGDVSETTTQGIMTPIVHLDGPQRTDSQTLPHAQTLAMMTMHILPFP